MLLQAIQLNVQVQLLSEGLKSINWSKKSLVATDTEVNAFLQVRLRLQSDGLFHIVSMQIMTGFKFAYSDTADHIHHPPYLTPCWLWIL